MHDTTLHNIEHFIQMNVISRVRIWRQKPFFNNNNKEITLYKNMCQLICKMMNVLFILPFLLTINALLPFFPIDGLLA